MLLNYLKPMAIFAAVVEEESFTQAGKKLDMPRGKVSEQVNRLETYLGVKLLQRSTRKVTVTAEGVALYQHAQSLLKAGVSGVDEVNSLSESVKGNIRITVTDDFNDAILLPILSTFCEAYPEVSLDIIADDDLLPVIDDSIDLAIRSGQLEDSGLISVPLCTTNLKLYCGHGYLEKKCESLSDIEGLDWISFKNNKRTELFSALHVSGKEQKISPNYRHSANTISSYVSMLENNMGIGVMSELSAQVRVQKGTLVEVSHGWNFGQLPISILYPSRRHMAYRTRLLLDTLKNAGIG
ncbi:putative Transcriptional regulator, LysR family [Vibrio nigripulchritudo MADA3029]|uniref:LysR family transcriptional regulator n=1 Tax=Vibrio nigripulchritudo TaxID=28173 RepID=UPI0003B1F338|nr:LysR family transcriptional regulator [Vibrio nigripulchritudo]CCN47534.1 putative Transcriptional regulator, LysR family [Vibrio nigripulchritudo MADA3020]CCN55942.1 putative Transcriptional regulator, LysR family [Vibrio nigripulchritudo MADA3021]CCN57164.1 putative Transcriptional regulator, LysR family [Vibrio nigripulchritudo MADA3029]